MTNDSRPSTILVTGATGQLGTDLVKVLSEDYNVIGASSNDFDIVNLNASKDFILNCKPDIIIHAAAFTAVDQTNPISVYGRSKLWGEQFVKEQLNKFFIIRIAWLYGANGTNFVKTMLKLAKEKKQLKVVNDQFGSPTWTIDITRQLKELIPTEFYGTYHCTSKGSCTWYEFAQEIFKCAGYKAEDDPDDSIHLTPNTQDPKPKTQELRPITLTPVTSSEFKRPAPRPKNSMLENYMLKLQNVDIMPHWEDSLKKFMKGCNFENN